MISTDIAKAINLLKQDGVIGLPTETVYGLAGNAFSEKAVQKIFELKERPFCNPLIVHIKSVDYLSIIAQDIPKIAYQLAERFWPGPLTMILKKKAIVPNLVTSNHDTVAVRIPNHPVALELLNLLDFPLAAPSANPFTTISPTKPEHVQNYFGDQLEIILDGGSCDKGLESTIVGFEGERLIIYRLGSLSKEELFGKGKEVHLFNQSESKPISPGMLRKHYAPRTPMYLTNNPSELSKSFEGKNIGYLLYHQKLENRPSDSQFVLSSIKDLNEAAQNLYAVMHQMDQQGFDLIIAERFPSKGLGATINDKLERASQ